MNFRFARRFVRTVAAITALALAAPMMAPRPASAAPPLLAVITLDPTAVNSSGKTGSSPFDATSFNPGGGTDPGTDSSATDHVIRTNDLLTYDFQFSVNSNPGLNVTLTSTLPMSGGLPVADWTSLPASCSGAGSNISADGQTLTCNVGAVPQGSARDLVASARVRVATPNGTQIPVSVTVDDPGNGATPVTTPGYWLDQSNAASQAYDTATSVAKFNLMKATPLVPPSKTYTYFGEGSAQGYYVTYPILIREGDGTANNRFGYSPAPTSISITDTLTPGLHAILPAANACGVNGSGATINGNPYGKVGVIGGATTNNSVVDSGMITCSQPGGAGTAITITIANANSSGTTFPLANAGGSAVENLTYVVSGYLRLWVADDGTNLGAAGTSTAFGDTYSGINPLADVPANLTTSTNLVAQGPAGAGGNSGKAFYVNANESGFPFSNAQGPGLTPGTNIVGVFAVNNTSTAGTGNVTINSLIACDTIDTTNVNVTAFDGTAGFPLDTNYGGAVHLSTLNGGSFADGTAGIAVAYGTAASTTDCSGTTGFFSSLAAVPGGTAAILRVKVTATALAPAQQLRVQIALAVNGTLSAGTIVHNSMAATGTASTGGAPFTTSASTQGQILVAQFANAAFWYKNITSGSLFSPTGPAGSGGLVDSSQQFVGYLDTDGRQSTLAQTNVVTCMLVNPAVNHITLANFDGTTGAANATYGGPVGISLLNGTLPGSIIVQYSTDPVAGGDTCTSGTWSAANTLPGGAIGAITKVRVTFATLPQNTRVRMFVNVLSASGLATGITIPNNAVTSVNGGAAMNATQNVTTESETVSVTKTGPGSAVAAGSPATFQIQGFVQGILGAQSGTITITDTLSTGLLYVPGSATLTIPGAPSTYIAGTANATPTSITTNGLSQQVIVWNIGMAATAPGVFIQMPKITYQATPDISVANGLSLPNTAVISDSLTAQTASASASVTVTNPGAFHITKLTPTPTIIPNGTITWQLNYANTGATPATSTDFIDELPYNGDVRGSAFNGTIALATAAGSNGETVQYTKAPHGQINEDPGCTSNGGVVTPPTGGCVAVAPATTIWCPALSGGTCPATLAEVTAIRLGGGALPSNSGTRTITVTATTNGNQFLDIYWNTFGARTNIITLGVHSPPVQTIVPVIPNPILALVKSCPSPVTCTSVPQAPGTDITYALTFTNTGGRNAGNVTITDPMPPNMDFKIGSPTATLPGGLAMTVSYSSDGSTFTYTPTSGGGGAPVGYDRNVLAVRWTLTTGTLSFTAPANTGSVTFIAQIR